MIGLFCKRALEKRRYSAKETNNVKKPSNRSHPIQGRGGGWREGKDEGVNTFICV